jgi:site-specific DNA-methyltransferase (adenine-specific)
MKPYYEKDGITIFNARCEDVLPTLAAGSVDLVLTDPPYSPAWHAGARTGKGDEPLVTFASLDADTLRTHLTACAPLSRRWFVATMDWRHIAELSGCPPVGWRFVRFGVWVKPNGAPQFTGDRPGPGWEGLAFLHRADTPLRWNGGGRSSVFVENKVNSQHPTGKPLGLWHDLVPLFSEPGDLILDPFMGGGSTAVACLSLGRRFVGIEVEEKFCEVAVKRLQQQPLFVYGAVPSAYGTTDTDRPDFQQRSLVLASQTPGKGECDEQE